MTGILRFHNFIAQRLPIIHLRIFNLHTASAKRNSGCKAEFSYFSRECDERFFSASLF